jgi:hypothetical protein
VVKSFPPFVNQTKPPLLIVKIVSHWIWYIPVLNVTVGQSNLHSMSRMKPYLNTVPTVKPKPWSMWKIKCVKFVKVSNHVSIYPEVVYPLIVTTARPRIWSIYAIFIASVTVVKVDPPSIYRVNPSHATVQNVETLRPWWILSIKNAFVVRSYRTSIYQVAKRPHIVKIVKNQVWWMFVTNPANVKKGYHRSIYLGQKPLLIVKIVRVTRWSMWRTIIVAAIVVNQDLCSISQANPSPSTVLIVKTIPW